MWLMNLRLLLKFWLEQCKEERVVDAGPLDWEKFKVAFFDRFLPLI